MRPDLAIQFKHPHCPEYLPGWFAIEVGIVRQLGPFSEIKLDSIRINHYWTRDEYYFENFKKPRRKIWEDSDQLIELLSDLNFEYDVTMLRYDKRLRERVGF